MIKKIFGFLFLGLLLVSFVYADNPKEEKKNKNTLSKTQSNDQFDWYDGNQIFLWLSNTGKMANNPNDGNSGLIWPKTASPDHAVIFEDGPLFAGLVNGAARLIGSTYRRTFQAGPIVNGVAADPQNPKYKVYKIQKDWLGLPDGPIKQRYQEDYDNWPGDDGAPYIDNNGNGKWDKGIDQPKFIGDQQVWWVMNDMNSSRTNELGGCLPIGMEVQVLVFGFNLPGPLGNIVFRKFTYINKGGNKVDSAYTSMWSDPDLGDAGDDLVGCDTSLSMGYIYNGKPVDAVYGATVPAAGYDFFQGPLIKTGNPNDIANWNFGKRPGYKNLGMTSFTFFINASTPPEFTDPPMGSFDGTIGYYWLMKGYSKYGNRFTNPLTKTTTNFVFNGDPVKATGWRDGTSDWPGLVPGDRRLQLNSGPFTMMPGDTQEVVIATVIGSGSDNLSSIAVMKNYDLRAQAAYEDAFVLPSPPPAPKVEVALEPRKVSFYWGGSPTDYAATEGYDFKGYAFEGYNIYQLPTAGSTKAEAKLLATYDLANGLKEIWEPTLDALTGKEISLPVLVMPDEGVKHYYIASKDMINSSDFVPNQKYYFAISAFCFNPDPLAVPAMLENPLRVIEVIPQSLKLGYTSTTTAGNAVTPITKSGLSDGVATVLVVDPTKVTGHDYEIVFDTTGSLVDDGAGHKAWVTKNIWKCKDLSTGKFIVTCDNQNDDGLYPTVDGLFIKVTGPTLTGLRRDDDAEGVRGFTFLNDPTGNTTYGSGHRFFNPQNYTNLGYQTYGLDYNQGLYSFGWVNHPDAIAWFSNGVVKAHQLKKIEIWFNSDKTKWQKAYRYMRRANQAVPAGSGFDKFIVNKTAGYAYQDYVEVPFTVWNVDATPPVQLSAGFMENNEAFPLGEVDARWKPTTDAGTAGNNCGREFIFIFASPYTATAQDKYAKKLDGTVGDILYPHTGMDLMYAGLLARRTATTKFPSDTVVTTPIDVKVRLIPYYPNSMETKFKFTAPSVSFSKDQEQKDVNKITVFPNPYFGSNLKEQNRYMRFVTINHLPKRATIKIYTLAGHLIKVINKDDDTQFASWNLTNDKYLDVASGIYIAHVDMPDLGVQKVLKICVVMEVQFLERL